MEFDDKFDAKPDFLMKHDFEKKFAVPKSKVGINSNGGLDMSFGNNIMNRNIEYLINRFITSPTYKESVSKLGDRLRALQTNTVSDGNGGLLLETGEPLFPTQ